MAKPKIIPVGKEINHFTIEAYLGIINNHASSRCKCRCGTVSVQTNTDLRSNRVVSCRTCSVKRTKDRDPRGLASRLSAIEGLIKQGVSVADVAIRFGVSPQRVYQVLSENKIPLYGKGKLQRYREKIEQLWLAGEPSDKIAKQFNSTAGTIQQFCAGLVPPGERRKAFYRHQQQEALEWLKKNPTHNKLTFVRFLKDTSVLCSLWDCKCGTKGKVAMTYNVLRGRTKSCGCLVSDYHNNRATYVKCKTKSNELCLSRLPKGVGKD